MPSKELLSNPPNITKPKLNKVLITSTSEEILRQDNPDLLSYFFCFFHSYIFLLQILELHGVLGFWGFGVLGFWGFVSSI